MSDNSITLTRIAQQDKPPASRGVWEERWHPLREEWVVVAAHRQNRPWSGETLEHDHGSTPDYVDDCYLCPRNERVGGLRNDDYTGIYVFDNDLPCVGPNAPSDLADPPATGRGSQRTPHRPSGREPFLHIAMQDSGRAELPGYRSRVRQCRTQSASSDAGELDRGSKSVRREEDNRVR